MNYNSIPRGNFRPPNLRASYNPRLGLMRSSPGIPLGGPMRGPPRGPRGRGPMRGPPGGPQVPLDYKKIMMVVGGIFILYIIYRLIQGGDESSSSSSSSSTAATNAAAAASAENPVSTTKESSVTKKSANESTSAKAPVSVSSESEVQCTYSIPENRYSGLGDCSLSSGSDQDSQPWELTMDADSTCSPICQDGEILSTKLKCKEDGEIDTQSGLCVSTEFDISSLFNMMDNEFETVNLATDIDGEATGIILSIPTLPPACRTRDELSLSGGEDVVDYLNQSGTVSSDGIQVKVDNINIPCSIIEENCNVCDTPELKTTCLCEYQNDIENNSCSSLQSSVATCPS